MSYRRFYAPKESIHGDTVIFTAEESHHLTRVVRLQAGDVIEIFDGIGSEYRGRIERLKPTVQARILEALQSGIESPLRITLIQGLTKFDKFDYIVQKATELGVLQIAPMISERTEVRWTEAKADGRVGRWQKIALEAAKQCRRSVVPRVQPVVTLERALQEHAGNEHTTKLCLTERQGIALNQALRPEKISACVIVVGPEGGWSDADLSTITQHGYHLAALGPRTLRTETAALVALSILQYRFGDLG